MQHLMTLLPALPLHQSCVPCPHSAFSLEFYTEVMDLRYLLSHFSDQPFFQRYKKLNEALVGLVEDYSLVSFIPLNVQVRPLESQ